MTIKKSKKNARGYSVKIQISAIDYVGYQSIVRLIDLGENIEKGEKEKKKIGWRELIRELASRLKEEISLLAVLFALIVALVVISTPHYSVWVAVTFIALYFLAVTFYFAIKGRKTKSELQEKSREYLHYKVSYPAAFQNPHVIVEERPTLGIVHFDISFDVMNLSKKPLKVNAYIKSSTQAVGFVLDAPKKVWRRRFGIVPYREEVELSLDDLQTLTIDPNDRDVFTFHGWYRPHHAFRDFDYRRKIPVSFRIYAESREDLFGTHFDTEEKKIEIPFQDHVTYADKE